MPRLAINIESHGDLAIVAWDVGTVLERIGEEQDADIEVQNEETITVDYPRRRRLSLATVREIQHLLLLECPGSKLTVDLIADWHND